MRCKQIAHFPTLVLNLKFVFPIFRHVILPPDIAKLVPKTHLMTETEWRNLGVQQSPGWVHYMLHAPEPHVLLFRRPSTATNNSSTSAISNIAIDAT